MGYRIKQKGTAGHEVFLNNGYSEVLEIEDKEVVEALVADLQKQNPKVEYQIVPQGQN